MQNIKDKTNTVYINGEIEGIPQFSYETNGEKFYEMTVKIPRLSGSADYLPVTISERLMTLEMPLSGRIYALGQLRTYNRIINGKARLLLTIFVREVLDDPISKNPNQVVLAGYICKQPIYRTTPLNREITDLCIAVNRNYGKSDYIPAIAWGRNANFANKFEVGDAIVVSGRIQNREYQKATDNGVETRTTYEVSVDSLYEVADEEAMNNQVEKCLEHLRSKDTKRLQ